MASQIDWSPLGQSTPETATSRGMSHLSSVLDAIMARDAQERQHKAQLAQAAALAAEDDKRMRDQLNHTIAHDNATEDIAREKNAADAENQTAGRALQALPGFKAAKDAGDIEGMKEWAGPGGIGMKPQAPPPPTPAMDLLGALTDKPAPADPLGPQPTGGEQDAMGGRPSGGAPMPPAPNPTPSLLDAQLASGPKPPAPPVVPKYDVTLPGGATSVYDPEAAQARRQTRGAQVAGDLGGLQSPSPFHAQALAEVQAMAKTGRYKTDDEVLKAYEERRKDLEHEANAERRAHIVSAAKNNNADRVHPPGELDFLDPDTDKVIGKARSPEEGQKFRVAHDALVGIRSAGSDLKAHLLKFGRTDIGGFPIESGDVRGDREALISNVTDYLTTLKNTGVLNGGEYDRYVNLLGTSVMRGGPGAAKVIDQILNGARTHYMSHSGSARAATPGGSPKPAAALSDEADQLLGGQ